MTNPFHLFVRKSVIKKMLDKVSDRVRLDERKIQERKYEAKIRELKVEKDNERKMDVSVLESKVRSLGVQISEMEREVARSKEVYFKAVKRTKENVQLSIDLGVIAESMINESAGIYTRLRDVSKKVLAHNDAMEKESRETFNDSAIKDVAQQFIEEYDKAHAKTDDVGQDEILDVAGSQRVADADS